MNGKIFKELFIIILLFIVVIFTLGMLFFDSINVDVQKMEEVSKKESTDIDNLLDEVDLNSDNNEKVNITKSVSKEDLEKYRQENSYDTGKKNPFSGVSDIKENTENSINDNKDNNENESKNDSSKDNAGTDSKENISAENNVKENSSSNSSNNNGEKNTNNTNTSNSISNSVVNNNSNKKNEDTTGRFFENKTSK